MPRFDGTGPMGAGPGTGRGLGNCGAGRGYGRGFGYGYKIIPETDKKQMLEEETKEVEDYLNYLKEELKKLK